MNPFVELLMAELVGKHVQPRQWLWNVYPSLYTSNLPYIYSTAVSTSTIVS